MVFFLFFACNILFAQYYVRSRKNISFLLGNQSSLSRVPTFNPSLEFATVKHDLIFHAGAGRVGTEQYLARMGREQSLVKEKVIVPNYFAVAGIDMPIFGYCLAQLPSRAYCSYIANAFILGVDGLKDFRGPINSSFGYRVKCILDFSIERSGSAKRDIRSSRHLQVGYAYTKHQFRDGTLMPTHSILINFLLVRYKLIKFADWY